MKIGIGIVGCGRASAELHLPALSRVDAAHVVALADVNPERLRMLGERYGIKARFKDHRELLARTDVDAVLVAVPPSQHAEVGLDVLGAGKHLLMEKPLAANMHEGRRLARAAAAANVCVAVGHNLRCHRLIRQAKDQLNARAIGEIDSGVSIWTTDLALRSELPEWRTRRHSGGGTVHEIAIHHFDLWRHLLGREIEEVSCVSTSSAHEEAAAILCRFEGGVPVTILVSQRTAVKHRFQIFGRKGTLGLDCDRFDGLEVSAPGTAPWALGDRAKSLVRTLAALPSAIPRARAGGDYVDSYRLEWKWFLAAVRGQREIFCTVEDGLRSMAAAHAASLAQEQRSAFGPSDLLATAGDEGIGSA